MIRYTARFEGQRQDLTQVFRFQPLLDEASLHFPSQSHKNFNYSSPPPQEQDLFALSQKTSPEHCRTRDVRETSAKNLTSQLTGVQPRPPN
jgi:hypothetical protein